MKKLLILFFATSLFVACNNNKKDDRRSDRDREREKDDYRTVDDEKESDRDADYKDDRRKDDSYEKETEKDYSSGGWSSADVRSFVSECVPEAAKNGLTREQATEYCECMQVKIERMYPDINDAAKIDMESPKIQQMVLDCAPKGLRE
jgi:hypothetical protein